MVKKLISHQSSSRQEKVEFASEAVDAVLHTNGIKKELGNQKLIFPDQNLSKFRRTRNK